ncbi:MAG: hypothetical protein COU06_01715 [Candidatus Harrisonbacteria bacterium CG10_big_fil_rev_8_21_14_0_10_38_8]|uniref:leucine--tRNA ligase n=1 Tax=Candidatus Harrisonbacteria bacterium CG10_big_fil_rev_8_21_14_0_10_38_8 TaxID=1974582 RepID=A0A2M6WK26_9BACT|nr:MAG: hypothetical protein COU06_01715 [Candidatus Harrisonbacteria bacterium CG10_big_fil_rev_8_21_14_0_10_38_8]
MDSIVPASHTIEIAKNLKATLISKEAKVPHFNGKEEPVILETLIPRIKTFTTRPDTIQAVTCLVLAPEHELINLLQDKITNLEQVRKYQKQASAKTDIERSAEGEEKTGVKLQGVEVVNPYNNEKIPVYIADYVLAEYGTGAVMAVPAYDSRDAEFSKNLGIPFSNADLVSASEAVKKAKGKKTVKYKLRDWVFSRQRYWGEPIPVVNCNSCGYVPVPKKDLPVTLPKVKKYLPRDDGKSPLASITSWVNTTCPKCKGSAQRETDVMPNWAGSSWYFLRYTDPKNVKEFASEKSLKAFTPVDWYNGGMEHVTLHLLYSRFWNLFLFDQGLVPFKEPYKKRTKHGMILAEGGVKMSKSKENTISPDEITKEFGADSLRVYEMFMGPFDQAIAWEKRGILGPARFLEKVYKISQEKIVKKTSDSKELLKLIHKTIKKVSDDIESMSFNTAISSLMVLVNQMSEEKEVSEKTWKLFLLILAPFAPHITEELWLEKKSIHIQPWPTHDEALAKDETFELVIQVNSKLRGKVQVDKGISKQKAEELARSNEQAKKWLEGKEVKRVIFIKDRLINLIV